jgi:hypothetical protein
VPICHGLKKHVSMYWHYDPERNLYAYTPDSLEKNRLENFKDCIYEKYDTLMIYKLFGKPFDKDKSWCTYCLTTSREGESRCYLFEFNSDGKCIKVEYFLDKWIN